MKNSLLTILLLFFVVASNLAQQPHSPKKHIVILTGIGVEMFNNPLRFGSLNIERPIGTYQHIGIVYSRIFGQPNNSYYYDGQKAENGFDVGVYGKYFLHGRFTGRKSGFYFGPDVRFGKRNYEVYQYDPQSPTLYSFVKRSYKVSKFMFRWGMHWNFGKFTVLELCVPTGFVSVKHPNETDPYGVIYEYKDNSFVILPSLMLGISF